MRYDYRIFDKLDSTSTKLKDITTQSDTNAHLEGLVVQAYEQTAGYGRRGGVWQSPLGGLYMSVYVEPNVSPDELPTLTKAVGVAMRRAAAVLGCTDARIKEPNDIVIAPAWDTSAQSKSVPTDKRDTFALSTSVPQKLAGTLCETKGAGVVIGIGMNVVHFGAPLAADAQNQPAYIHTQPFAQDSRMEVDHVRDIVLNTLSDVYSVWHEQGFAALQDEYNHYLLE